VGKVERLVAGYDLDRGKLIGGDHWQADRLAGQAGDASLEQQAEERIRPGALPELDRPSDDRSRHPDVLPDVGGAVVGADVAVDGAHPVAQLDVSEREDRVLEGRRRRLPALRLPHRRPQHADHQHRHRRSPHRPLLENTGYQAEAARARSRGPGVKRLGSAPPAAATAPRTPETVPREAEEARGAATWEVRLPYRQLPPVPCRHSTWRRACDSGYRRGSCRIGEELSEAPARSSD